MEAGDGRWLVPALGFVLAPAIVGLFQTLASFQHRGSRWKIWLAVILDF